MNKVFVYGTLKKDYPNTHHMSDEKHGKVHFVGDAYTKDKYPLIVVNHSLHSRLPFLLDCKGKGNVSFN